MRGRGGQSPVEALAALTYAFILRGEWPQPLTLLGGVTSGATGALAGNSNKASTFSGTTTGTSGTSSTETGPQTFSVESWFKTTSSSGGKLIGFGNSSTGSSSNYDRHLYMNNTGRLTFGTLSGSTRVTIASTSAYNDRQWHHVVATSGPDGMRLYVDGVRVASGASTANASYPGYWKLGYDTLSGWPNRPAKSAVAGDVDEFAVYHRALSGAEAADHFLAGRRPTSTWSRRPRLPG